MLGRQRKNMPNETLPLSELFQARNVSAEQRGVAKRSTACWSNHYSLTTSSRSPLQQIKQMKCSQWEGYCQKNTKPIFFHVRRMNAITVGWPCRIHTPLVFCRKKKKKKNIYLSSFFWKKKLAEAILFFKRPSKFRVKRLKCLIPKGKRVAFCSVSGCDCTYTLVMTENFILAFCEHTKNTCLWLKLISLTGPFILVLNFQGLYGETIGYLSAHLWPQ